MTCEAGVVSDVCGTILSHLESTIRLHPFSKSAAVNINELYLRYSYLRNNQAEFYRLGKRKYVVVTSRGAYLFDRIGENRKDGDTPGYFRIIKFEREDVSFRKKLFRSLTASIPGERKVLSAAEYQILDDAITKNNSSDSLFENAESDGLNKVFRGKTVLRPYLVSNLGMTSRALGIPALAAAAMLFTPKPFGSFSPYFNKNIGPIPKLVTRSFDDAYISWTGKRDHEIAIARAISTIESGKEWSTNPNLLIKGFKKKLPSWIYDPDLWNLYPKNNLPGAFEMRRQVRRLEEIKTSLKDPARRKTRRRHRRRFLARSRASAHALARETAGLRKHPAFPA
jgi:hypothetical protein